MRVSRTIFLAIILIAGWVVWGHAEEPKIPKKEFAGQTAYEVVRVIDGDTVVLLITGRETKVRLIGVDTPETVHPQKAVEVYGKEASRFLTNLLKGESVYLEYEGGASQVDKYGRLLAYLYRVPDGLFINFEIIRQGYGHAYTRYPFKYMESFRYYERKAKEAAKGLWGIEASSTPAASPSQGITAPAPDEESVTVYVTRTGKKYHRGTCRYLRKSKIPVSLEDAKKGGYNPCKVCKPPQ